jgi:hypothetical protein
MYLEINRADWASVDIELSASNDWVALHWRVWPSPSSDFVHVKSNVSGLYAAFDCETDIPLIEELLDKLRAKRAVNHANAAIASPKPAKG